MCFIYTLADVVTQKKNRNHVVSLRRGHSFKINIYTVC